MDNITKNRLYIVGVSGGPDSMFLLDNLRIRGYKLVVAHINYKKRVESDQDEILVKNYCQKYFLPWEFHQAENSEYNFVSNFQDRARKIRYDFFQRVAEKYQTKHIVIAHHRDDYLETYLLQKKRNSLVDYWGLPISTRQGKFIILRPILNFTKKEILKYLKKKEISYIIDITNQLPIYRRNIIRQELNNLNKEEKISLEKEIKNKNQELKKTKLLVRSEKKKVTSFFFPLQLIRKKEYSKEVHLRLLYFWINKATNGLLQQRKKHLLAEVYRQLFASKKASLSIKLGSEFQIFKYDNSVFISPKLKNTKK